MRKNFLLTTWIFAVLVFSALACQTLSGVQEQASTARQTLEAAATTIDEGRELLGTAQALSTQVGGQSLIPTAQALATEIAGSGAVETAKAAATDHGAEILSTAHALATSIATEHAASALETVQAYATEFATGTPPEDIPLLDIEQEVFVQSPFLVSYSTALAYDQVLEFYKTHMPRFGWQVIEGEGFETSSVAFLSYVKGDRRASISLTQLPADGKTLVVINVVQ